MVAQVRACTLCPDLPLGPLPILQASDNARVLIVGQAPGRKTHARGLPFDDVSGDRLRAWMGIDRNTFYDAQHVAALPMGFCYPGTGTSGDLPPRPVCAATWRAALLARLPRIELTLVLGRYAMDWHLQPAAGESLAAIVSRWRDFWPTAVPMPHPSPRNNRWLRNNPAFEQQVLPALQARIAQLLRG